MIWLRNAGKSSFVRGVALLSSGQVFAGMVPIFTAPILGRLYTPSEYGVLGSYMAISTVFSGIGNWQFSQAVIVEKRENKAIVLLVVCVFALLLSTALSLAVGIGLFFFQTSTPFAVRVWFLFLPLSTFIAGVNRTLNSHANRRNQYRWMAIARVTSITVSVIFAISMGFASFGITGLFTAYFSSQFILVAIYIWLFFQSPKHRTRITRKRLMSLARKHRNFAFFSTPAAFVGNVSLQLPIYAMGMQGALGMIGLFSRASQLLGMPLTLVGTSIGQVFQQRAAAEYSKDGNCKSIYLKTFLTLAIAGLFPAIVLAFFAPQLFALFLGAKWFAAGGFARVLAPMLYLRLVSSPLSSVFSIVGYQREDFFFSLGTLALTAISIGIPLGMACHSYWIVVGFSFAYSTAYIAYILRGYQLSQNLGLKALS